MRTVFTLVTIMLVSLVSFSVKAQHTHHDITKLDDQIEVLMDTAARQMCNFILTQKESYYDQCMATLAKADSLNKSLTSILSHEKSLATTEMKSEIQERSEEFQAYYKAGLKEQVLNEKKESRKETYKFHGHHYMVGATSKKLVNEFIEYLPAN